MNFVQQMMKQSASTFNYYQSYYLAKWWIEFGLTELTHRGIGFDQVVNSWSAFISWNFLCAGRCDLRFALSWTSNMLSDNFRETSGCQDPFVLTGAQSLIVPLFKGNTPTSYGDSFSADITYTNLYDAMADINIDTTYDQEVVFGMLVLSGEDLSSDGIFFRTGDLENGLHGFLSDFQSYVHLADISNIANQHIDPYRFYFMISNPGETKVTFCLASKVPLPTQQYYLKSRWAYDDQQLGLDAVYKQPIPDFLANGYMKY